ncbi:hypothetical protein BB560_007008 [Smittium megazygosporum]|uniref:fructose-2,6-bisphosphate 2-phosphatase n=1 Tax=Smittium megazygosporum TaxID=133381 RepID=A0A2T9XZH8_9FUNG|nr:hypothetical protein BB560_007008 [Smittium megazygosporum]
MHVASTTQIAVVLVGLPARGKTYIGRKVQRYLLWLGICCRVFNVGDYRREAVTDYTGHEFFDSNNKQAEKIRNECSIHALNDMLGWFSRIHSGVAIYDATNSTIKRRKMIYETCQAHNVDVMFVESWCDDEDMILKNIIEVKKSSPDYTDYDDFKKVEHDFQLRIEHYKEVYQEVGSVSLSDPHDSYNEADVTYVRKINVGAQMVINKIKSYMQSRIVYFLMNIHIVPRSILFSRHGESLYNQLGLLGGDSSLSPNGAKYARALPFLVSKIMGDHKLTVWTSTLNRTIETASYLPYKKIQFKALDEINAGLCDGLTYSQVKQKFPEEYVTRNQNKFEYRYRGGESYRDVVLRLEPIIMELERQQNIMIVSHQAVLRCIYAYFLEINSEELPYIKIPLHTVMKLTWTAYGCEAQMYSLDIAAVDTHIKRSASTVKPPPNAASPSDLTLNLRISGSKPELESFDKFIPELIKDDKILTKHVEVFKFAQKSIIPTRLVDPSPIKKAYSINFPMEAQPVSSPKDSGPSSPTNHGPSESANPESHRIKNINRDSLICPSLAKLHISKTNPHSKSINFPLQPNETCEHNVTEITSSDFNDTFPDRQANGNYTDNLDIPTNERKDSLTFVQPIPKSYPFSLYLSNAPSPSLSKNHSPSISEGTSPKLGPVLSTFTKPRESDHFPRNKESVPLFSPLNPLSNLSKANNTQSPLGNGPDTKFDSSLSNYTLCEDPSTTVPGKTTEPPALNLDLPSNKQNLSVDMSDIPRATSYPLISGSETQPQITQTFKLDDLDDVKVVQTHPALALSFKAGDKNNDPTAVPF